MEICTAQSLLAAIRRLHQQAESETHRFRAQLVEYGENNGLAVKKYARTKAVTERWGAMAYARMDAMLPLMELARGTFVSGVEPSLHGIAPKRSVSALVARSQKRP